VLDILCKIKTYTPLYFIKDKIRSLCIQLNHFVGDNVEYDMSLWEEFNKDLASSGKGKPRGKPGSKGLIKTSSFTMV
jgi:hypothetical protein